MTAATISPFDFTRFQWHESATDPRTYVREAFGVEALMGYQTRFHNSDATQFLGVTLDFNGDLSLTEFVRLAREAWFILRFDIPTIAATPTVSEQDQTFLTYHIPSTFGDVQQWATRTLRVAPIQCHLETMRYELGQQPNPDANGDSTFLYITAENDRPAGLLLQASHVVFDAQGLQILMCRYLRLLALMLVGDLVPDLSQLGWGREIRNLVPPVGEVLAPNEPREGWQYEQTLHGVLADFDAAFPQAHPLQNRLMDPGSTRRTRRSFTVEESEEIRAAATAHGFTVSEIFHAALCLVIAQENPQTNMSPKKPAFVFLAAVNGRPHRLATPYSRMGGYPGMAAAVSTVSIPVVDALRDRADFLEKALLLELAWLVKQEYEKQKESPALLAVQGQLWDVLLAALLSGATTDGPTFPALTFFGDSIEDYLDRNYTDRRGREVLSIGSVFSSLNRHDTGRCFRVASWRETLQIDIDYNDGAMSAEAASQLMDNWVRFARLLLH